MSDQEPESTYHVGTPQVSGTPTRMEAADATPAVERVDAPRAVFVAHGMGQQVRFATMDDFAHGICAEAEQRGEKVLGRTATAVRVGCTDVQRIEIEIKGKPAPVHIYEGYWAPLTEGQVGLHDVLRFLIAAAVNGIRSGRRLHRWLFGKPRHFIIPRIDVVKLWAALIVLLSIVVVGATILTVGIARLTFASDLTWLSTELVTYLTGVFESLLTVILICGIVAAMLIPLIRKVPRTAPLLWLPAGAAGLAFFLATVVILFELLRVFPPPFAAMCEHPKFAWCFDLFDKIALPTLLWLERRFCEVERVLRGLLIAAGAFAILALLVWIVVARPKEKDKARARGKSGRWTALGFLVVAVVLLVLALCNDAAVAVFTWLTLLGVAMLVRYFLIQFVGDVAAYVSPHVVDRFFDLRNRVRDTVWNAARAVYALRDKETKTFVYDRIVIAGHSLGSVVVYDVLNRLMNDDILFSKDAPECCGGEPVESLSVRERTKLLLTYGSPLDKTAFMFSMQDAGAGSERDALAATLQPLIKEDPRPFEWRNIWSPYDIFSGPLGFYDTADPNGPPEKNRVQNDEDPDATILFAAHNQYGEGPLLFRTIYDSLWK